MKFKEYLSESINDKGIMKAIILGGLSASGKTTIINKIITDGSFPISIPNTDIWTEYYKGEYESNRLKIKKLTSTQMMFAINSLLPI